MNQPKAKISGVFQYFYHCKEEILPIRDICNTQGHGEKTEPHYENLTENWCSKCMNGRIKSANRRNVDYLFLVTRYRKENHRQNGKLLVVGFLFRAKEKVWQKLNASIQSGVNRYVGKNPQQCGFFAGDEFKSHFVSAEKSYELKGVKNGRWKYLADEETTQHITSHLIKSKNILNELRKRTHKLTLQISQKNNEKENCKTCK